MLVERPGVLTCARTPGGERLTAYLAAEGYIDELERELGAVQCGAVWSSGCLVMINQPPLVHTCQSRSEGHERR